MMTYSSTGHQPYFANTVSPYDATNTTQLPAASAPLRKSFLFMVDKMATSGEETPTVVPGGIWMPPTGRGENVRKRGDTTGTLFLFDGNTAHPLEPAAQQHVAPHLRHYRDMSIYHDQSRFWAVESDATRAEVSEDWMLIGFNHDIDPYTFASYVMRGGPKDRLRCQRPGQRWARTLLPPNLQCPDLTADTYPGYGGMIGQLNIIIALMALSVKPHQVAHALSQCMVGNEWRGPNISEDRIGKGWQDRRGVVVRVYTSPNSPDGMTQQDMMRFESGAYSGKILS